MDWWSSFITQAGDWWGASQPLLAVMMLFGFFMTGLIGCILPVVPGPVIIWTGMVIHKIWVPESSAHWTLILVAGVFVGFTSLLDYILTILGAKKKWSVPQGSDWRLDWWICGIHYPSISDLAYNWSLCRSFDW